MNLLLLAISFVFSVTLLAQNNIDPNPADSASEKNEVVGTIAKPSKKSNKAMDDLKKETKKTKIDKKKKK
jgi:hypothetical protein